MEDDFAFFSPFVFFSVFFFFFSFSLTPSAALETSQNAIKTLKT